MLISSLSDFISLIPAQIHIISINKSEFKKALGIRNNDEFKGSPERKGMKEYPYRICASIIFAKFARYLRQKQHQGMIVADSRRGGDSELIKTLELCKEQNGPLKQINAAWIRESVNAICFASKGYLSGGLEITDLISYTAYFHVRRKMSTMSDLYLDRLWQEMRQKMEQKAVNRIREVDVRRFFKIKEHEVHRYLSPISFPLKQ